MVTLQDLVTRVLPQNIYLLGMPLVTTPILLTLSPTGCTLPPCADLPPAGVYPLLPLSLLDLPLRASSVGSMDSIGLQRMLQQRSKVKASLISHLSPYTHRILCSNQRESSRKWKRCGQTVSTIS